MTLNGLQRWMKGHKANNEWWVSIGSEVQDRLMSLAEISKLKEKHPTDKISVLHKSKEQCEDPEWIPFKLDAVVQTDVETYLDSSAYISAELQDLTIEEAPESISDGDESTTVQMSQDFVESIQSQLSEVRSVVEDLKAEVAALCDLGETLKQASMDAKLVLEERESFIGGGEISFFEIEQSDAIEQTDLGTSGGTLIAM